METYTYIAPGARRPRLQTVTLWHPASPDTRITIKPGLLRRLGLRNPGCATLSETYGAQRNAA